LIPAVSFLLAVSGRDEGDVSSLLEVGSWH